MYEVGDRVVLGDNSMAKLTIFCATLLRNLLPTLDHRTQ